MANDWKSNLGDPSLFDSLPMGASPVTAAGDDPDEVRLRMAYQNARDPQAAFQEQLSSAMKTVPPVNAPAAALPSPAPAAVAPGAAPGAAQATPKMPATALPWAEDAARTGVAGQTEVGRKLLQMGSTAPDESGVDNAQLALRMHQSAAPDPNAAQYRPGFGTRLVRGLRNVGLGFAEGGLFGALRGGLAPETVVGGEAYGAPTDAYDTALAANKKQVAADQANVTDAMAAFKAAQDQRAAQEKELEAGGKAFGGAATGANAQENAATNAAKLPIEQQDANARTQSAFNTSPEGKLQITQNQIDQRTKFADAQGMPHGVERTRYILTGQIQPGRQASAEEIAVARVAQAWRNDHNGQPPKTVADWQSIYTAAKGAGGGAGGGANLRTAARIAAAHVKTLEDNLAHFGSVMTADQKADTQAALLKARDESAGLQAQLNGSPDASNAPAKPPAGNAPAVGTVRHLHGKPYKFNGQQWVLQAAR